MFLVMWLSVCPGNAVEYVEGAFQRDTTRTTVVITWMVELLLLRFSAQVSSP
jgi:hypothetical protein